MLTVEIENRQLSPEQRRTMLERIVALRESELGDAPGAFEAQLRLFALAPADGVVLRVLRRLAEAAGAGDHYVTVLEEAIRRLAGDHDRLPPLLVELADHYALRPRDGARAAAIYRQILGYEATHPAAALAAAEGLDRYLGATDGAGLELIEVLLVRARLTADAHGRLDILRRLVGIQEAAGLPHESIETYRQILELDGGDLDALVGLEKILEREKRWLELIEVLRIHAKAEPSQDKRRQIFDKVTRLAGRIGFDR